MAEFDDLAKDYAQGGSKAKRPSKPEDGKSKVEVQELQPDGSLKPVFRFDKKWYQRQSEWLFWMYANNYTGIPFTERAEILNNRMYAQGRQPAEKYMKNFAKFDKASNRWKTWLNISFDIFAIIPKFRAWILGSFDKVDYNISANCVDETAGMEREMMIYKKVYAQQEKDFYDAVHFMLGQDNPEEEPLPFIPQNQAQVQMLIDMGFIKLVSEQKIEELLKQSEEDSKWKTVIKRKLFEDAFDVGRMWVKDYIDPVSKKIKTRYVDPAALIVRSRIRDVFYEDITHAGEVKAYTVGDLRAYGIKDEELAKAVRYYSNKCGNITYNIGDILTDQFYDCIVYVLDGEFESFDFEKWEFRETDGMKTPYRIKTDAQTKKESKNIAYPKWHRAKWVIGTDIVFDYGYQFDVPYTQDDRPTSSYSGVKISDRAPVSLIITDADDIQIAILKLRTAIAKSRPAGVVMDFNAIREIAQGGTKMSFPDIVAAFNQTGDMLAKNPTTPNGQAIAGINPPIIELKGGYGTSLTEAISAISFFINNMREKLGVGANTDGSQGLPETSATAAKIAEQGTSNVLRNMLMAYQSVKEQDANKRAYRFEIQGKADLLQQYEGIVGVEALDLMKFLDKRHHGINVNALIDDDMKLQIMQKADISLNAAKTGGVGINFSDYFVIMRLCNQGLLKSAELYLSYKEEKTKQDAQQLQEQNMKLNGENMQQQEAAKMKAMIKGITLQLQADQAIQGQKDEAQRVLQAQKDAASLKETVTKIVMETQKDLAVQDNEPAPPKPTAKA